MRFCSVRGDSVVCVFKLCEFVCDVCVVFVFVMSG